MLACVSMAVLWLGTAVPEFAIEPDVVRIVSDGSPLAVSLRAPRVVLDAGELLGGAAPRRVSGSLPTGLRAEFESVPVAGGAVDIALELHWSDAEKVLRKWATLRFNGAGKPVVREVILEELEVAALGIAPLDGGPPQSYPAFGRGFFAGVEYPVASTRLEGKRLWLGHRPGRTLEPGAWYETRKAVIGLATPGREREAFLEYISAHRPTPRGLHFNYNSWWTSSVPFTEDEILGLMETFESALYQRQEVALDTFAIDMGWSNAKSLWDIDRNLFPDGFNKIREASERMGGHLGLWTSPSSCYNQALDNAWAAENGFETFEVPWPSGNTRLCCLGGPNYRAAFRERLVEMVTKYGVRHIKLDGYVLQCPEAGHGHEPGEGSSEAIAQGGIEAFEAVRTAAPDTWLETTCFGWNPSPWWLFYVNSVIGTYGDDAPHGRVPCPVYRESYTTARDFFNLQGAARLAIPIEAQEVLGVIHQSADPFTNDAVTTLLRGHAFVPLYINPKYMDESRWRQLACLITWARNHAETLAYTEPILPVSWRDGRVPAFVNDVPMPREPYGYAHWAHGRGIVLLRNPWIAPVSIPVQMPEGDAAMNAWSLYPEHRAYGRDIPPGSSFEVPLAPYETVVLTLDPEDLPSGLPEVDEAIGTQLAVARERCDLVRVEYQHDGPRFGPDFTCLIGDSAECVRMTINAGVTVRAGQARLLVLMEGPVTPAPPQAELSVNGTTIPLAFISSDAGFAASMIPGAEHWAFYGADLPAEENNVSLRLETGADCARVSAWVMAGKPGRGASQFPDALPSPEVVYLDAAALVEPVETASVEAVVREPAPVERIDGVFLDALEPESVSQGWGKLERNRSVWDKPLTVGGKLWTRGLGTHAPARIAYALDGSYQRFQAVAGADGANRGTLTFEVWVDGAKKWESGLVTPAEGAVAVDVDITGARRLELVVGDGGDGINGDHADWAGAKLVR